MFTICGWLNPRVWNPEVWRANYEALASVDFGIHVGSWKRSSADTRDDCNYICRCLSRTGLLKGGWG